MRLHALILSRFRRYITEGGRVIPGASTIHFDEISRKRIFQAIDNANFSDIKLIRENYTNLKIRFLEISSKWIVLAPGITLPPSVM